MTALREAAQQALEALERLHGGCTDSDDGTVEAITIWVPEIIDDLRAALAEPVQEPVAWRFRETESKPWSLSDDGYYISCKRDQRYFVEALYTAPPQRKPRRLTDAEIGEVWFAAKIPGLIETQARLLIRAAERRLAGEK